MTDKLEAWDRREMLLTVALALCLAPLRSVASAPIATPDLVAARSQSGQFVVYAGRSSGSVPPVLELAKSRGFVQLEPTLVTISCERIKQILLRELDATAPWRGTIYLVLYPARGAKDAVTVTSERFTGGWQYRLDMPDVMERTRYVRTIVQVLLAEMANRSAPARAAEVPLWLSEGFTQLLLDSNPDEIILAPPQESLHGVNVRATVVNARRASLQEQVQKKLRGRPALSFENLSWPAENQLSGPAGGLYSGSAQLFVGELLRLPDGRACLRTMLYRLPQHFNWQLAFLGAFRAHFERPLDAEKWWSLVRAETAARDPDQTWAPEESWRKLDQAIHASVQVRTGTNELPLHAEVPLQTIIQEWDKVRQTAALQNALRALGLIRLRIAPDFAGLVQDYYQSIDTYLQQRDSSGSIIPFVRRASRRRAVENALRQLNALDARRETLRPAPQPTDTSQPLAAPTLPP